jgi:CRISPR/Cas system CSM-associated protein Csm2 small subunit
MIETHIKLMKRKQTILLIDEIYRAYDMCCKNERLSQIQIHVDTKKTWRFYEKIEKGRRRKFKENSDN